MCVDSGQSGLCVHEGSRGGESVFVCVTDAIRDTPRSRRDKDQASRTHKTMVGDCGTANPKRLELDGERTGTYKTDVGRKDPCI